jgi:hypothetical protein
MWRFWDGTEWTSAVADADPPAPRVSLLRWPPQRAEWIAFGVSAAIGLAIWIPTAAMKPRVSHEHPNPSQISGWYLPLMIVAALVLGAIFAKRWPVVGVGLVVPQLALAPWTTPQGDGDGLWLFIFPILLFVLSVAWAAAGASGEVVKSLRDKSNPHTRAP